MSQGSIVLPTTGTVTGLQLAQAVNTALAALGTNNSGNVDPGTALGPYAWWADTGNGFLKQRDPTNTFWTVIAPLQTLLATLAQTYSAIPTQFSKVNSSAPAFSKTGSGALSVNAGTVVAVAGAVITFSAATVIAMPALVAGTDYYIYACSDGTVRADASASCPTGYSTANSRQIGGFHYGLILTGATVASGAFATTGNGMIWTQNDVNNIAGINAWSIWDLKWRPNGCAPQGMALVHGKLWVDIYLCSTNTATNGTSKSNTNIASGTVLPIIPPDYGGNGVTTYPTLNWWVASELAHASQKRLLWEHEFVDAAFGVTENQSIDATASTYPNTQRNPGYTSKWGIEQAAGVQWIWGLDSNFYSEVASPGWTWKDLNGNNGAGTGRGEIYTAGANGISRVLLGGARASGAFSGSRASLWNYYPWDSNWGVGLRAACDHLTLV